jgi:hypothetical protein
MNDLRVQLADLVAQLVDPYDHAEPYTVLKLRSAIPDGGPTQEIRVHRTKHPSLLDQLAAAVEPSSSTAGGMRGGYASNPSARLAAIDRLLAIEVGSAKWVIDLDLSLRKTAVENLRALVGASEVTDRLVKDAERWVTWARVVTAWEVPPRALKELCPSCGLRGTIRVRLDPTQACCVECGVTWIGDAEIAVLAQHVRWCNGELESVA